MHSALWFLQSEESVRKNRSKGMLGAGNGFNFLQQLSLNDFVLCLVVHVAFSGLLPVPVTLFCPGFLVSGWLVPTRVTKNMEHFLNILFVSMISSCNLLDIPQMRELVSPRAASRIMRHISGTLNLVTLPAV